VLFVTLSTVLLLAVAWFYSLAGPVPLKERGVNWLPAGDLGVLLKKLVTRVALRLPARLPLSLAAP
jgi:hypothetical protein